MFVDVIIGGLYGDEGKGKIVSSLGHRYDYIFRVNASTNASHTVQLEEDGPVYVTKQIPSIFFNQHVKFVIAPGAVLNLDALYEEISSRPDDLNGKLLIASNISLLIPAYIEASFTSAISTTHGSTHQGTGIAVLARTRRHSLKLYDIYNYITGLLDEATLISKLRFTCMEVNPTFFVSQELDYYKEIICQLVTTFNNIKEYLGDFCIDYTSFLTNLSPQAHILIEGCNGLMLDNLHGLSPYTTSASTGINALLNGANLSPYHLCNSYIVCSGYFCCLNKRPFLTEMNTDDATFILRYNSEIDDAEGMQRRIGWFDLPTLKRAVVGHRGAELVINKLDIMQDLDVVKICVAYRDSADNHYVVMPDNTDMLKHLEPVYKEFKGWGPLCAGKELPPELIEYIQFISSEVGLPIRYLGIGRKDTDLIKV